MCRLTLRSMTTAPCAELVPGRRELRAHLARVEQNQRATSTRGCLSEVEAPAHDVARFALCLGVGVVIAGEAVVAARIRSRCFGTARLDSGDDRSLGRFGDNPRRTVA